MRSQTSGWRRECKKAFSWSLLAAILCGLLLLTFAVFYFTSYSHPYMNKNMADISDNWQYYIGSQGSKQKMSVLQQVDVPANETLTVTRPLKESFQNAALMLKSNHQRLRVYLDDHLIFESPYDPNVKNPGMGLHFILLPENYLEKLLRIEITSPYAAYSGAPYSVYLGDIPSLEAYGWFSRSLPHKLLMVCCLAAGAFMMGLAIVGRRHNPDWWGNFSFGVFSVLFGFYFPSGDAVAYQLLSPVLVSQVSIGLYYLYPIPLMLYFYSQFRHFRKAFLPAVVLMSVFSATAFSLQILGVLDFPELLSVYNPLYILSSIYLIILGFAQIKKGGRFIRFTIPWLTLVFLISMQSLISFYTTRVKQDETLYEMAIFTLILVVWLYNVQEYLRIRAQEQHAILELRTQNKLILQSYQNTTKHLDEVAAIRHEMKNHIAAMQILMENDEYKETTEYLLQLSRQQEQVPQVQYCEHYLLNAILNVYLFKLRESGVKISADISVAKELNIPADDLSSLVMNILDNASEALARMGDDVEKWLELNIRTKNPYLYIFCKNPKSNSIEESEGGYISSKQDKMGHGYGLKVIRKIVEKHDGLLDIDYTESFYSIEVAVKEITK
ncbi:GHKL domain-containing protein [Scatolibacter rhodanostii]|uniref:GHKL domain-containing protein n=1 Tax=Scatolibacter rhodanostii TaxID=2014781 RepID=UPI000C072352|nr:GHKL domain-containing protein [Scatolibacter rhodanostii]